MRFRRWVLVRREVLDGYRSLERKHRWLRQHVRRDGKPKIDHVTEAAAEKAAKHLAEWKGKEYSPYPCPVCGGWHVGHRRTP